MNNRGYFKLNRGITSWRWFKNPSTFMLFLYLLLNANFADADFETHRIKRGQIVTSRSRLASDLGMSERAVRTAISHLVSTNDIVVKTTSKYSIITVVNYEEFQEEVLDIPTNEQQTNNTQLTHKQQTNDRQTTGKRPQYNNDKKNKNDNKNNKANDYLTDDLPEHLVAFENRSLFKD